MLNESYVLQHKKDDSGFVKSEIEVSISGSKEKILDEIREKHDDLIILNCKDDDDAKLSEELIPEILLLNAWPMTRGIPFCKARIEHMSEIFVSENAEFDKNQECSGCIFLKWCRHIDSKDYSVKAASEHKHFEDIRRFLENEEKNTLDRF